jgi:uncharacterized membrane protein (DUF2068 family)
MSSLGRNFRVAVLIICGSVFIICLDIYSLILGYSSFSWITLGLGVINFFIGLYLYFRAINSFDRVQHASAPKPEFHIRKDV